MTTTFTELLKNAEQISEEYKLKQDQVRDTFIIGESGAGMVKINMNGAHAVSSIDLDKSLLGQPKEVIEELITDAFNDAIGKADDATKGMLPSFSRMFNLGAPHRT